MLFFDHQIEPIPSLENLFDNLLARGARPKQYRTPEFYGPRYQAPPLSPAAMHEAVRRRDERTRELNEPEPKGFVERVADAVFEAVEAVAALKGKHRAAAWLRERLSAGPLPAVETERAALAAGITATAFRRGRKILGIKPYQSNRVWYLTLPAGSVGPVDR